MGDGTEYDDATVRLNRHQAKWLHNALARAMYAAGMDSDAAEHEPMWQLRALIGMAANLNSNETVEISMEIRSWG